MSKELDILAEWVVWGSLEKKRDIETILLKGHLLLEMILDMILLRNGVNDCRAFSFYRKIGLLDKLNVTDRNKLEKVVVALTQINTLRNRLAHEVLFIVDNSDFSYWAIEVLANFNGAKFTKYTYRTKIIHAFSVLSKNILELDQSIQQ